jgi:hypothetical protein
MILVDFREVRFTLFLGHGDPTIIILSVGAEPVIAIYGKRYGSKERTTYIRLSPNFFLTSNLQWYQVKIPRGLVRKSSTFESNTCR